MMEVKITLESKVAASNLLRSLHSQYLLGHLCDVTVQAGSEGNREGSFQAHRAVLAASSAYFRKVFIGSEPVEGLQPVVLLRDVSTEDFAAFAEFAYTASVEVTKAQLPRLRQVATRLECRDLGEACRVIAVTTPPDPTDMALSPEARISNPDLGKCETPESNSAAASPPTHLFGGKLVGRRDTAAADAGIALATRVVIRRIRFPQAECGVGAQEEEEAFRCEECGGAAFDSLRVLQAHTRREHWAQLVVKYACDLCPQLVATRQNLREHRAAVHTSERAHACTICGKRFKRPKDISDHARRVHGRKTPQQCPRCGKVISSKAGLVVHLRTHTGEKPYRCADCGLSFAQKSSYNTHTRNVHQAGKGRKPLGSAHQSQSGSRSDLESVETPAIGGGCTPVEEKEGGSSGRRRERDRLVPADTDDDARAEVGRVEGEDLGTGPVLHAGKDPRDEAAGNHHNEDKEEEKAVREEEEAEREEVEESADNKDHVCNVGGGGIAGQPAASECEDERGSGAETEHGRGQGSEGKVALEASGSRSKQVLQCDRCEGWFRSRYAFVRHYRQVHGGAEPPGEKSFRCETCGRSLASAGAWREHRDCVHSEERHFACNVCGGTFKRQRDVRTHCARKHEGRGQRPLCSVCGRILSSRSALQFHMRTHTGEKPYLCPVCNQRFAQPSQLKTHTRGHTGERPYICEVCGANFGDSGKLTTHSRTHTGQRLFQCDMCKKSFTSKEYLKHHKVCHLGAKPFQCERCGKSFGLRSSYFQHCRVHSDTRPFFCELCGKSFTQQGSLQRHRRIHTGEKPFKCKACERTFTDMSTLRRHVAVHDKKAEWRTYVIDLTDKKGHNWSKIQVFGVSREDGRCGDPFSSVPSPITEGSGHKKDQSRLQL